MTEFDQLRERVGVITREMLACNEACPGVACDVSKGVIPRGLYLEPGIEPAAPGAIICGLNPGSVRTSEAAFYRTGDIVVRYREHYDRRAAQMDYFKRLREFARTSLGVNGPLLFTDTVKCEKLKGKIAFNHATSPTALRTCSAKFLSWELMSCPESWIAVAAGREAFISLCHLAPGRTIVGIYHPTGSRQHFPKFAKRLTSEAVSAVLLRHQGTKNAAVWLPTEL